jgi:Flp pilus assembly protein TadD
MKRYLAPFAIALLAHVPVGAAPEPTQPVAPRTSPANPANSADEFYARGLQALSERKFSDAKRWFGDSLKANDRNVMAMLGLVEVAFQTQSEADIKRWLQKAEQTDPNNVHVLITLGRFFLTRGQADKAENVLNRAVEADPKQLQALIDLADAHSRLGALDKAQTRLRQAAALAPQNAQVQQLLGITLQRSGKMAEAEAALLKAAELDPKSPDAFVLLAQAETRADAAMKYIDQALKRSPQHYEAQMLKVYWQYQAKDAAGVRKTLDEVMKQHPKAAEPWVRKGMLASAENRSGEAKAAYKAALERDGNHPIALNNLAMLALAKDGEGVTVAEAHIRKALRVLPNNGALQDTLAAVLVAKKDVRGALTAIQLAAKLEPRDAGIQLHLAEIQLLNGDKAGARRTAEAIKSSPGVNAARLQAVLRQAG